MAATVGGSSTGSEPTFGDNFAGMALRDQDGRRFTFDRLQGRIVLVHFIFTGCSTICPVQTRALLEMLGGLSATARAHLHIVSVSLDPLSDSPAALKAYAQRMGMDLSRWSLVTGRPQDIDRIAQSLRLFAPPISASPSRPSQARPASSPLPKPDSHTTRLWLIDPKGRLVQRYPGNPPDRQRLTREIENLDLLHTPAHN